MKYKKSESNGIDANTIIIFVIFAAIIINTVFIPKAIQFKNETTFLIKNKIISIYSALVHWVYNKVTITIFFVLLIWFLWTTIHKSIRENKKYKIEVQANITKETDYVKSLLNKKIMRLSKEELKDLSKKLKKIKVRYISLIEYRKRIKIKLKKIRYRIIEIRHENRLEKIKDKILEKKRDLELINYEIELKEEKENEEIEKIKDKLKLGYKDVYRKSSLSKKEIEVIENEEYNKYDFVNEYSVIENKTLPFFVRKIQHHSATHSFLVWDVKNLLNKFSEIEGVIGHETREADITFKIKRKTYAIEVETGSLIRKQKQFEQKIDSLNEDYGNRWLILVSNKNLVSAYKKYGKVSTRKSLKKDIEEWIKDSRY